MRCGAVRCGSFDSFPWFLQEREGIIKDTEALFRLRKKQASAAKAQVTPKVRKYNGPLSDRFVISV